MIPSAYSPPIAANSSCLALGGLRVVRERGVRWGRPSNAQPRDELRGATRGMPCSWTAEVR